MKLVVGLGNSGEKYKFTRHNVGFMVIDALVSKFSIFHVPFPNWEKSKNAKADYLSFKIDNEIIELIKPQAFMNDSGKSVSYAVRKHKISNDNIYVVHDDLDIKLGEYKIVKGKGPREHNGLLDIYEKLGTKDFWHVRVGVDNREKDNRISGENYVLMSFLEEEMMVMEGVINEVLESLIKILKDE